MCPDGHLVMVDKYGFVRAAPRHPDASTRLDPEPVAHLGPGRPLGTAFDADGNLLICDALKVCVYVVLWGCVMGFGAAQFHPCSGSTFIAAECIAPRK